MRFYCQTCPYVYTLKTKVVTEVALEHKAVDDVLGGPEAWKNADQTDAVRAAPRLKFRHFRALTPRDFSLAAVLSKVHQPASILPAVRLGSLEPRAYGLG